MKNHERKNRRFNNWFSSTFYSIFVKNLEVFAKFSKIRHICVGLRTSRLLVYLLGRHYYQCLTWLFIMTSLSDVSIKIFEFGCLCQTTKWWTNEVMRPKHGYFSDKNLILNKNQNFEPRKLPLSDWKWSNFIKSYRYQESLCTQNSWFLLRKFWFCRGGNFYLNWIFVW